MNNNHTFSPVHNPNSPPEINEFKDNFKINSQGIGHLARAGIGQMAKDAKIDLTEDIPELPVVLSIGEDPLFFLGDFSLIIGKAKSRKSFLNTLLIGALLNNPGIGLLKSNLNADKCKVILFDTEQGSYHAQKSAKRVLKLIGADNSQNFDAYSLRKFSAEERCKIIEYVLNNTSNIGVVFIDGIRDLVTSINDEEQATKIASKLMKWSQDLNIHICCTLHMNKSDKNARGHLGTELMNKSLVAIAVTLAGHKGIYSKVEITESREQKPPGLIMAIDDQGLPFLFDKESEQNIDANFNVLPQNTGHLNLTQTQDDLNEIFQASKFLTYTDLVQQVKSVLSVGENKAKGFVKSWRKENLIGSEKRGNKTIYYRIGLG